MKAPDVKIKAVPSDIYTDWLGMYVPKTKTIYYLKLLDSHPELKEYVINHEMEHARKFNISSNKELMINLMHEIRTVFDTQRGSMIKRKLRFSRDMKKMAEESLGVKESQYPVLFFYAIVYSLLGIFIPAFIFPVYLYYALKEKCIRSYLVNYGLVHMILFIVITTSIIRLFL
jgi:hypothetical protein